MDGRVSNERRRRRARASRTLALVGAATALGLIGAAWLPDGSSSAVRQVPTELAVGDVVSIAGTNVTCSVRQRSGARGIECVRAGGPVGTYGSRMTEQRLVVFRFERRSAARTVFAATQGKRQVTRCHHE